VNPLKTCNQTVLPFCSLFKIYQYQCSQFCSEINDFLKICIMLCVFVQMIIHNKHSNQIKSTNSTFEFVIQNSKNRNLNEFDQIRHHITNNDPFIRNHLIKLSANYFHLINVFKSLMVKIHCKLI